MQRIQYAKAKSDCIAKAEGTYDKKKKQEEKGESSVILTQFYSVATICLLRLVLFSFNFPSVSRISLDLF